jgi:hypothetical protein
MEYFVQCTFVDFPLFTRDFSLVHFLAHVVAPSSVCIRFDNTNTANEGFAIRALLSSAAKIENLSYFELPV